MDLALTRRGDYAVRAALCLAKRGGGGHYVKIREVAQTMALPASYTPQVLRSRRVQRQAPEPLQVPRVGPERRRLPVDHVLGVRRGVGHRGSSTWAIRHSAD
jgi:hypothetical protein